MHVAFSLLRGFLGATVCGVVVLLVLVMGGVLNVPGFAPGRDPVDLAAVSSSDASPGGVNKLGTPENPGVRDAMGLIVLNGPVASVECGYNLLSNLALHVALETASNRSSDPPAVEVAIAPEVDASALPFGVYTVTYSVAGHPHADAHQTLYVGFQIDPLESGKMRVHYRGTVFQGVTIAQDCGEEAQHYLRIEEDTYDEAENTVVATAMRDDGGGDVLEAGALILDQIDVRRPNFLFVNIDDLNDWVTPLTPHGDATSITPHLHAFAKESAVFERAYTTAPICNPARASLITGRHPVNTGHYYAGRWYRAPGADNNESLVRYLHDEGGYVTRGAGKFGHDGGVDFRSWERWQFGSDLRTSAPDSPARRNQYFPRPAEPVMMNATTTPSVTQLGVAPWYGAYALTVRAHNGDPATVNPESPTLVRMYRDDGGDTAGYRSYEVDLYNVSKRFSYGWTLCMAEHPGSQALQCLATSEAESDGAIWAQKSHGLVSSNQAPYTPAPHETIQVYIPSNDKQDYDLVLVERSGAVSPPEGAADGDGAACDCAGRYVEGENYNPVVIRLRYFDHRVEWGAVTETVPRRRIKITNLTDAPYDYWVGAGEKGRAIRNVAAGAVAEIALDTGEGLADPQFDAWWGHFDKQPSKGLRHYFSIYVSAIRTGANEADYAEDFVLQYKEDNPVLGQGLELSDALIANQVITWLNEDFSDEQLAPFFLSAGIYRPHFPMYVPQEYLQQAASVAFPENWCADIDDPTCREAMQFLDPDDAASPSPWGHAMSWKHLMFDPIERSGQLKAFRDAYLANVMYADEQFGRMLSAIDNDPYLKASTIVVVWSDHGFHIGERSHMMKGTLWERGTRIPMFVRIPGATRVQAGETVPVGTMKAGLDRKIGTPVSLHDLYPTLLDLAGLSPPGFVDSLRHARAPGRAISLKNLILGETLVRSDQEGATVSEPVLTSWVRVPCGSEGDTIVACGGPGEGDQDIPIHAIRDGNWRYIRYKDCDNENDCNELYDISRDQYVYHPNILQDEPRHKALDGFDAFLSSPAIGGIWPEFASAMTNDMKRYLSRRPHSETIQITSDHSTFQLDLVLDLPSQFSGLDMTQVQGSIVYDASKYEAPELALRGALAEPDGAASTPYTLSYHQARSFEANKGADELEGAPVLRAVEFRLQKGDGSERVANGDSGIALVEVRLSCREGANCADSSPVTIFSNVVMRWNVTPPAQRSSASFVSGVPAPIRPF